MEKKNLSEYGDKELVQEIINDEGILNMLIEINNTEWETAVKEYIAGNFEYSDEQYTYFCELYDDILV